MAPVKRNKLCYVVFRCLGKVRNEMGQEEVAGLLSVDYAQLRCWEQQMAFIHSLMFAEIWYEEASEEHEDSDLSQSYWIKFGTES